METYYRKRSRMATSTLSVMDYQDSSVAGALAPIMPSRHSPMPTTPNKCTVQCSSAEHEHLECNFKIEVGSIYEVDHIYLPPRTPVQLRAMRVVMVSEKTALNVAVRYPSLESLHIYFSNSMREMYPALDEKFVMGTALADKVLLRQVPTQEFAEKKHLESFWVVDSISASIDQHHLSQDDDSTSSKGVCLSELKVNGMVRWGVRRQVRFLRRHEDNHINNAKSSTSSIIKDDGEDDDEVPPAIDVEKQEEDDDEENEQEEFKEFPESDKDLKRKRYSFRHTAIRKAKKVKREKQQKLRNNNMKKRNKCKMLVQFKNPKDRWSEERYKMAEKNLLEVMRGKEATATNPILRPELRTEARKRIGDTGLLDHLLKHMAGKVAPGGTERFRRRHNADGAMEYWLESADLVNVRKEAGVSDPYWIPPPGWKPGDCLTPDPISAHELKFLKNEIFTLRRDLDEMALSKKHMEEDVERLRREIEDLHVKVKQQETPATVISKEIDCEIPPVPLNAYKEQLQVITSAFLAKMEEQMENFVHKLEEKERVFSTLAEATSATLTSEKRQAEEGRKKELEGRASVLTAVEEKAAKIQRLKSGFRICKPQGTFLWPTNCTPDNNNMSSPKVVIQVEDLFMVPTPPSVSSSSVTSAPPLHLGNSYFPSSPVSPVKPVPERPPAVKVTVSSVSNACSSYTPMNNNTNLIYLNDDPFNGDRLCGTLSSRQTVLSSTDMMPSIFPSSKHLVMSDSASKGNTGSTCANEPIKSASTSSMPREEGTWLALATPNTIASGESCQLAG